MLKPGDKLQESREFISGYHDEIADHCQSADMTATVLMIERTYEAQRRLRTHFVVGTIAIGQQWRYLKHSLAITTVNRPFSLNFRSQAIIQPITKLTVPYNHIPQLDMHVGVEEVRDHLWDMTDELLESNGVGLKPFPIFLDHLESMISEAKEADWNIV